MLKIALFGGINLSIGSTTPAMTHSAQVLLAYLVLYRHRPHSRHVLAGRIWGSYPEERAQNSLRTALWRLRRALEPEGVQRGTYLIASRDHGVAFNSQSPYWLDVAQFETAVRRGTAELVDSMTDQQATMLENAISLYSGDLLDGFYDEWVLTERDRLYRLFIEGTEHLMHFYRRTGRYERALSLGRLILQSDPLQEDIHRQLMLLHLENGQRILAIRQYELCRETLLRELGIEPMARTQELYRQVMSNQRVADERLPRHELGGNGKDQNSADMSQVLNRLEHAIGRLNAAQGELQHAINQVCNVLGQNGVESRVE